MPANSSNLQLRNTFFQSLQLHMNAPLWQNNKYKNIKQIWVGQIKPTNKSTDVGLCYYSCKNRQTQGQSGGVANVLTAETEKKDEI